MIYFENIRWKNFLSTGNQWTDIPLNAHSNTIIVGENGAGKSTLMSIFQDIFSVEEKDPQGKKFDTGAVDR